jgi:nucleotide-binding universal stress UspA family protein
MPKMADFKHILVAVDFGESSDQATDLAMQLAAKFGSALTLVHTYEIPSYAYPNASFLVVDLLAPIEEAARKQLDKALVDVQGRFPGAKAVLRHGAPAAEILATIEEVHADLLVAGTHGRRGISRTLLGSVAEKLVRMSPVPVLTVRHRPTAETK